MYNKDISEKIVSDCFDMMDNIRETKNVCKGIVDRAREDKKVKDYNYSYIFEEYKVIESRDVRANRIVEKVVDINGGVKGYDTDIYMELIKEKTDGEVNMFSRSLDEYANDIVRMLAKDRRYENKLNVYMP